MLFLVCVRVSKSEMPLWGGHQTIKFYDIILYLLQCVSETRFFHTKQIPAFSLRWNTNKQQQRYSTKIKFSSFDFNDFLTQLLYLHYHWMGNAICVYNMYSNFHVSIHSSISTSSSCWISFFFRLFLFGFTDSEQTLFKYKLQAQWNCFSYKYRYIIKLINIMEDHNILNADVNRGRYVFTFIFQC